MVSIFDNRNEKYPWWMLNYKYKLPEDVLSICLSFNPIRFIKADILINKDTFVYNFKTELDESIASIQREIGGCKDIIYNTRYRNFKYYDCYCRCTLTTIIKSNPKFTRYTLIPNLQYMIDNQSLTSILCDHIFKISFDDKIGLDTVKDSYKRNISITRSFNYKRTNKIIKLTKRYDRQYILWFSHWSLYDMMALNPNEIELKEFIPTTWYKIELFTDYDGVTQWVSASYIFNSDNSEILKMLKPVKHITRNKDYKHMKDIEFEDPETVHRQFKNKKHYFINIISAVSVLEYHSSFDKRMLGIWIMKCLLHNEYGII